MCARRINFTFGIGILGLPHAVAKSGLLMSAIVVPIIGALSLMTMLWMPEVAARAEGVIGEKSLTPWFRVTYRKFEVNQLCRIFLGGFYQRLYELVMVISLYGALWSFASVAVSSMAANVPLPGITGGQCDYYSSQWIQACETSFLIWGGIFAVIVIFLSCLDFMEQTTFQVTMTFVRFIAFGLMMASAIIAIYTSPGKAGTPGPPYYAGTKLFDVDHMYAILATATFACVTHHSAPGLMQPLQDKMQVRKVFTSSFVTTTLAYVSFGITTYLYFGDSVKPLSTLNWSRYPGYQLGAAVPVWAMSIAGFIVVFPVLDILSVYPLCSITLANSMCEGMPLRWHDTLKKKKFKVVFRLLASVPAIVGLYFVRNLSTILTYTGLVNVVIAFVTPALLQRSSKKFVVQRYGPEFGTTPYSSFASKDAFVWIALAGAFLITALIITGLINAHQAGEILK